MKAEERQESSTVKRNVSGRDEMNLAEFPIASLGKRKSGVNTLVFADQIFDHGSKRSVTRALTVNASDTYGLPTSLDEEVILGLIQLTAQNNFQDSTVYFTRYELLKLLGWKHHGRNDLRLQDSLKRWTGVTLHYDKAWWDKEAQSWVSEHFHIIDSVSIYDHERRKSELKRLPDNPKAGLSKFRWGEEIFKSFKAGNLKKIDFDFYTSLSTAIAKRTYRFLDKRFYKADCLSFDLNTFAADHIGLSNQYNSTQLKRTLLPAITELENRGFITPLPQSMRFSRLGRGNWQITFNREAGEKAKIKSQAPEPKRSLVRPTSDVPVPAPRQEIDPGDLREACERFGLDLSKVMKA